LCEWPSKLARVMTPKGQAAMQYEQPLQMSGWM
jgi:hypothetical protein